MSDIHKTRGDYFYSLKSFLIAKDLNGYKRMLAKAAQDGVYPEYCHADRNNLDRNNLLNILLTAIQNDAANLAFLEATLPYCKKIDTSCDILEAFSGLHLLLQKRCASSQETTGLTTDVKIKALELFLRHGADINKQTGGLNYFMPERHKVELDFGVTPVFIPYEPEVLEALIQNGADLNAISSEGYTVISGFLYKALPVVNIKPLDLLKKRLDTISKSIEVLLKHGAPVNSLPWGKSSIGEGLYYSEPPLITLSKLKKEYIYAFKARGERLNDNDLPALKFMDDFCLKICDMLVEHGADINGVDNGGNNVLNVCGSYELFKKFISLGADINHTNEHGDTMLNTLLLYGNKNLIYPDEFAQLFYAYIAEGGDVNNAGVYPSNSPLFSVDCDEKKILALVNAGADINHRNSAGQTPVAANVFPRDKENPKSLEERYETLKIFAELGADLTTQNDAGATLLHRWALEVSAECEKVGSLKRSKGTAPNDIKKAEERRDIYLDMLEFLVRHGANIDGNVFRGLTPAAIIASDTPRIATREIAPYLMKLIDLGADLGICDVNGNSAIDKIKTQKLQNTVRKYAEAQKLRNLELDNVEDLFER